MGHFGAECNLKQKGKKGKLMIVVWKYFLVLVSFFIFIKRVSISREPKLQLLAVKGYRNDSWKKDAVEKGD
jgi:hypothetical protein